MQSLTDYKRDITAEVVAYFEARVAALLAAGIAREHLVLDPGFGFAKTTEQNYELLAGFTASVRWAIPYWRGSRASR